MKKRMIIGIAALVLALVLGCGAALGENLLADHLKRIADPADTVKYTISTLEFGPLEPGENSMSPEVYIELLQDMTIEEAELSERPDGEYVVLAFPEEDLYYYFFYAEGKEDYVLQTNGAEDQQELFRMIPPAERAPASGVMTAWYSTLADEQGLYPEPEPLPEWAAVYDSEWNSENVWADVFPEDGGYKAVIRDSEEYYPKGIQWEYGFDLDEETKSLVSVYGVKFEIKYTDDGYDIVSTLSEDCAATLSINENGRLIWDEKTMDAGKGEELYKIGRLSGTKWVCDRATAEIFLEDVYVLKVLITWSSSATEQNEWTYACSYDAENDQLAAEYVICDKVTWEEGSEEGNRETLYEKEIQATFRVNEDGKLVAINTGEAAFDDMAFERLPEE